MRLLALLSLLAMSAPPVWAQVTVVSASGPTPASIAPVREQFQAALGGGAAAGANGSFDGLRREINWDGVPAMFSAPNPFPANFFNTTSPRGVVVSTPGTGFQVSAATTDGTGTPLDFGNINASYTAVFQPFSPQRLFTPLGSNVFDVVFFIPGTNTAADVRGFAVVLADVDSASATTLRFFDANNTSLGVLTAAPADGGLTFLGGTVPVDKMRIARVRVTLGNAAVGPTDNNAAADVVVVDDFLYSEPTPVPVFRDGFE